MGGRFLADPCGSLKCKNQDIVPEEETRGIVEERDKKDEKKGLTIEGW